MLKREHLTQVVTVTVYLCLDLITSTHLTSCNLVMDIKCMTNSFYDSVDMAQSCLLFIYSEVF